ncbi:carbon-nitrogen hydrolase family protein [Escherichia fergusonii]|nr:carbon-nitrogen hydrolase family protein [Escherichia fergusonii]
MSPWKIAAAQYEPRQISLSENISLHLEFIHAAARHNCELLVFPSLSLLGCDETKGTLPPPPDDLLLQPLAYAAASRRITVIAGLPVEQNDHFVRGIAVFAPWMTKPHYFPQSHGACLSRHLKHINVITRQPDALDLDSTSSLFTTFQNVSERDLIASTSHLQYFSHKYSIAVLMANARGSSALWDEQGQLIVRADRGSLLLTGQRTNEGWQGDIIPLR